MTIKKVKKVKKVNRAGKSAGDVVSSGPQMVTILVNGQVTGQMDSNITIGAASEAIASKAGLRTFSIKLDGKKLEQPDSNKTLKGATTFELFAKDARG